jgi:hypothetical protein
MQVISFGAVGQARVPSARSEAVKIQGQRVTMASFHFGTRSRSGSRLLTLVFVAGMDKVSALPSGIHHLIVVLISDLVNSR